MRLDDGQIEVIDAAMVRCCGPCHTLDIDVVADIRPEHVPRLAKAFLFPGFYLSIEAIQDAIADYKPSPEGRTQMMASNPSSGLGSS